MILALIGVLLTVVLLLGIKVRQQAIALKRLQQEKEDLATQFTLRNEELARSNKLCQLEVAKREKLQQIVKGAPVVVYAKEVDFQKKCSGKLWLINQEWQRIFALSEEEVIGKTDRELFPPKIADAFEANDRIVMETKTPLTTEEEVYHADGQLHTYLSLKFPLFDDNQQVVSIVGVATNITEKKQAKIELQISETRFRNTFEQAAVGIAHVALDGKWLRVNHKLCQIVGYTKEELLQKTFQDITYPDDLELDLEYIRQMLAGEIETYSLEKRYIRKDLSLVWINLTVSLVRDSNREPNYFIAVIEDISERKQLELSLHKSLRRLSNLHQIDKAILEAEKPRAIAEIAVNNIHKVLTCQRTSIVTFDSKNNTATILLTQGRAERLISNGFQVSLDVWQDLIASLESCDRDYIITYLSQFPQLLQTVPGLGEAELDCLICFPLKVKGKLLGIFKLWVEQIEAVTSEELEIVSEISDRVAIALQQARLYRTAQNYAQELEAKVVQRTAQLEEINRELKAFTYSISHDLRAPLRALQGFATALKEDYGEQLDDLGREYAERLVVSAQQMEQLIQDLLAYSRLSNQELHIYSVNLSLIVEVAIEQLRSEINKARAEITIVEPLLNIFGNRTVLMQVIVNLLSNAIKFVASGVEPQVKIRSERNGNYVRLWIEDNGIGINREHQDRIFRVFERLHGREAYSGTGIGLAIVKKGMERLGGNVGVESGLARGSRFWIEGRLAE